MYHISHKEVRKAILFAGRTAVNVAFGVGLILMMTKATIAVVTLAFFASWMFSTILVAAVYIKLSMRFKSIERDAVYMSGRLTGKDE